MHNKNISNLDKLKETISIVEVIKHYIKLNKKGNNYIGLCPFHNDKHASLTVNESKKIYKCFSCNNAGDVFTFVKNYNKYSYQEAVIEVCNLLHIDINQYKQLSKFIFDRQKNQILVDINQKANEYFCLFLKNKENKEALDYLTNRKIDQQTIKNFDIGFAPNDEAIIIDLLSNKDDIVRGSEGFKLEDIKNAGLAYIDDNANYVSYFKNRITFAIRNEYDEVIGFSARAIGDANPKYINTPTTEIFVKNKLLYNINNVIKNQELEAVYIVEGFMDVISLNKIGINNVLATMGVAFSKSHIELLNKLTNLKKVIICFDNDEAGQQNTNKTAQIINDYYETYIVRYDSNLKDMDEIVNANKQEALKNLNNVISFNRYQIEEMINKTNLNNAIDKKNSLSKICAILSSYKDNLELATDISYVAKQFEIDASIIKESLLLSQSRSANKRTSSTYRSTNINYKKYEVNKIDLTKHQKQNIITPIESAEEQIILFSLFNKKYLKVFLDKCHQPILDETKNILNKINEFYMQYPNAQAINVNNIHLLSNDEKLNGMIANDYLRKIANKNDKFNDAKVDDIIKSYLRNINTLNADENIKKILAIKDEQLKSKLLKDFLNKLK